MNKKIGTNDFGYPEIRNFIDLPHGFKFIKERDLFSTLLNIYFHFTGKIHPCLQFLHLDIGFSKTDLKHYFNTISLSKTPWIITFETTLPRLGNAPKFIYNFAVKKLASKKCKKIIAISQCSYDLQVEYIKNRYPEYLDAIIDKMIILHPPQKKLLTAYREKKLPKNKIIFTLIGSDFFRKGGREVLNIFDKLIPRFPELSLNIISSLNYGDYASKTTKKDYDKAIGIINKYSCNIKHFNKLDNDKVLELLKNSHIGLLPTWGDTYGYSVLESQACGCPVITTDIRALPEINNNDIGWIINVPKLNNGNGKINTFNERNKFKQIIETSLFNIVMDIIKNRDIIKIKGTKSMINIKTFNSINTNIKILSDIYPN